jgi:hypothetical protein
LLRACDASRSTPHYSDLRNDGERTGMDHVEVVVPHPTNPEFECNYYNAGQPSGVVPLLTCKDGDSVKEFRSKRGGIMDCKLQWEGRTVQADEYKSVQSYNGEIKTQRKRQGSNSTPGEWQADRRQRCAPAQRTMLLCPTARTGQPTPNTLALGRGTRQDRTSEWGPTFGLHAQRGNMWNRASEQQS